MTDEKKPDDEVTEEELDEVSGGVDASKQNIMESLTGGGLPDGVFPDTPTTPGPAGTGTPTPYPNTNPDGASGNIVPANKKQADSSSS